ncbi:MAG: ATP-binding cassette domain-containing protein, partial [Bacillota bacterium]|nr:ATP-binding cassette domain-containing protein [Bacillota bacterium]
MTVSASSRTAFEVNDLNLWYGEHHALKNINFPIFKKEVTAIIGPSGCGKSTFIKTLNLMINMVPNVKMSGEINFSGQNILNEKMDLVELRKHVGMVFQKGN